MIFYYLIVLFSAVPNHPWFSEEAGGVTLLKYVGMLCLLYALFHLVLRRSLPNFLGTWPARFSVMLAVWALASYAFVSTNLYIAKAPLMMYVSYLSIFFMTLVLVDSISRLRYTLLTLVGAVGLASLYSLREWQVSGLAAYRPGWVAGDANFFSAAAVLAIPLAYYLARTKRPAWERLFCLGCLAASVLAFVVSASRGGFVGLCAAFAHMFIRSKHKSQVALLASLLVPLMLFAPMSPIKRFRSPDYGDKISEQTHRQLWGAALQMIAEHPLVGVGLANFQIQVNKYIILVNNPTRTAMAHNTFLEYAAELGIFGALLYLGVLISTYRLLGKVRKQAVMLKDEYFQAAALGLQTGVLGFAAAVFFFSGEYEKPFWITVFVSACLAPLVQTQLVQAESAAALQPLERAHATSSARCKPPIPAGQKKAWGSFVGELRNESPYRGRLR